MGSFNTMSENMKEYEENRKFFLDACKKASVVEIDTDFEIDGVNNLTKLIDETKLLILGEVHGVKENADIIYTLYKKFGFQNLALEWSESLQEFTDNYLRTNEIDFDLIKDSPDGRITPGHFALLKQLKKEGILDSVLCIDQAKFSAVKDRDQKMAENVLTNKNEGKTMVVVGNLHSLTENFEYESDGEQKIMIPMAKLIKQVISNIPIVRIKYLKGHFFNCGEVKEFINENDDDLEILKAQFYQEIDGLFTFKLPEAHIALTPSKKNIL